LLFNRHSTLGLRRHLLKLPEEPVAGRADAARRIVLRRERIARPERDELADRALYIARIYFRDEARDLGTARSLTARERRRLPYRPRRSSYTSCASPSRPNSLRACDGRGHEQYAECEGKECGARASGKGYSRHKNSLGSFRAGSAWIRLSLNAPKLT
jgi:hypothetical protein